jgi:membrane-associated phospholipid phosphatase
VKPSDAIWLIPFGTATGVAIHYDPQAQQDLGINSSRINASKTISQFGSPYATFGGAAVLYFLGIAKHNEHLAETGRLGAEAVLDASIVTEGIKLATNRERPYQGLGQGGFWPHGTGSYSVDGSFPSGHAAASWALARVIASQYHSWPVQIGAYAFALAISASRVTAREHFPSDVLVGATFGYLIGGYVLHHRALEYQDFSVSIIPLMDSASRTYGLRLAIVP